MCPGLVASGMSHLLRAVEEFSPLPEGLSGVFLRVPESYIQQCRRPGRLFAGVQSLHCPGMPKHGEDHGDPPKRVTWPQVKLDPLDWPPLTSALGFADADCSIRAPGKAPPMHVHSHMHAARSSKLTA